MAKKKVLILCPPPVERGGVADYYRLVKQYFSSDRVDLEFYYTGKSSAQGVGSNRLVKSARDLIGLCRVLRAPDLVVLNPSLDPKAVIRDGVYHFLAKRVFGRKTLVFFHGWELDFERAIARHARYQFRSMFNFDRGVVLASQFKNAMIDWGYDPDALTVETTIYEAQDCRGERDLSRVAFLSRFEQGKGCLEAIQAVELAAVEFSAIKLYMIGDGSMMPELKRYVAGRHLENNVVFTGWLKGSAKYQVLKECGTMLYPTRFGEGMPICLLEGMGMGMVVITRPVAGIRDIVVDGENGYLIESTDPAAFAERLRQLLRQPALGRMVANSCKIQAEERFEISNVAKRMERIYFETGGEA